MGINKETCAPVSIAQIQWYEIETSSKTPKNNLESLLTSYPYSFISSLWNLYSKSLTDHEIKSKYKLYKFNII